MHRSKLNVLMALAIVTAGLAACGGGGGGGSSDKDHPGHQTIAEKLGGATGYIELVGNNAMYKKYTDEYDILEPGGNPQFFELASRDEGIELETLSHVRDNLYAAHSNYDVDYDLMPLQVVLFSFENGTFQKLKTINRSFDWKYGRTHATILGPIKVSPDMKFMAFASVEEEARYDDRKNLLYVTDGEGNGLFSGEGFTYPVWINEHELVVSKTGSASLYVIDVTNRRLRQLGPTGLGTPATQGSPDQLSVSHDRQQIAFAHQGDLYKIHVSTGQTTRLSVSEAPTIRQQSLIGSSAIFWSPDDKKLVLSPFCASEYTAALGTHYSKSLFVISSDLADQKFDDNAQTIIDILDCSDQLSLVK